VHNTHSLFSRLGRSSAPFISAVVLTWSSLASSGEIHDAAPDNDVGQVEALLKSNPDLLFGKDGGGDTPLHWAALRRHRDVAELLLANGADVKVTTDDDETPLHVATDSGFRNMSELLLANKAAVSAQDIKGRTPLHLAAGKGFKDRAEALRQHGGKETTSNDPLSTGGTSMQQFPLNCFSMHTGPQYAEYSPFDPSSDG